MSLSNMLQPESSIKQKIRAHKLRSILAKDISNKAQKKGNMYRVILSVLDLRKCEYLKDYSLDF